MGGDVVLKSGRPELAGLAAVGAGEFRSESGFVLHPAKLGFPWRRVKRVFHVLCGRITTDGINVRPNTHTHA